MMHVCFHRVYNIQYCRIVVNDELEMKWLWCILRYYPEFS
jgi:hypothetical protein